MLGRVYYLRHVTNVVGGKEAMVLGGFTTYGMLPML